MAVQTLRDRAIAELQRADKEPEVHAMWILLARAAIFAVLSVGDSIDRAADPEWKNK